MPKKDNFFSSGGMASSHLPLVHHAQIDGRMDKIHVTLDNSMAHLGQMLPKLVVLLLTKLGNN
jgi:hypothetical protein